MSGLLRGLVVCRLKPSLIMLATILALLVAGNDARAQSRPEARPYYTDVGQLSYAMFLAKTSYARSSAREFARLIEDFPQSEFIPEAQFRLAGAYLSMGRYKEADAELRHFLTNFPSSPFADEARRLVEEGRKVRVLNALPVVSVRDQASPAPEGLKAVQIALFEGKTYTEMDEELKRLKEAGIDTVMVRVFHNSGDRYHPVASRRYASGVYFKTANAPVIEDMLGRVASSAHSHGLRIFAWMTTRYADYGVEDSAELACKGYDLSGGRLERCMGLDLFNDSAVRRLEGIYSDLASYDIDGVLFQDDLMLRHTEGFGPYMEAMYEKDNMQRLEPEALYGRSNADGRIYYTPRFWEWASWKNRRLLDVAVRLKHAVRARRPKALFAINLMYESVLKPPYALAWLTQSLEGALKRGFDYYSIMAYHRQMEDELGKTPAEVRGLIEKLVVDAVNEVGEPRRVLIKIQSVDWKTGEPIPNDEVAGLIRDVRSLGGVSLAVVPYRSGAPYYVLGGGDGVARLQ